MRPFGPKEFDRLRCRTTFSAKPLRLINRLSCELWLILQQPRVFRNREMISLSLFSELPLPRQEFAAVWRVPNNFQSAFASAPCPMNPEETPPAGRCHGR